MRQPVSSTRAYIGATTGGLPLRTAICSVAVSDGGDDRGNDRDGGENVQLELLLVGD